MATKDRVQNLMAVVDKVLAYKDKENLGTDPATAQAICIIFACYPRIIRHFKMDTWGPSHFCLRRCRELPCSLRTSREIKTAAP